ncbi:hypothetical protein N7509_008195 [Penicillium cosmopolitanum]|uniref:Uncharacterized protein n=1 Tax=Penicillium cosmopolitanum TaxID=1131564 RepID=A0A9X0B2D1_9EURO|nr:uncharacterized protein N7509_008195 [Penicillium cosmopolitanum]KAJ5385654.1 hypothetical protein N7509_008195 [Penicillium cosmopolitanum]
MSQKAFPAKTCFASVLLDANGDPRDYDGWHILSTYLHLIDSIHQVIKDTHLSIAQISLTQCYTSDFNAMASNSGAHQEFGEGPRLQDNAAYQDDSALNIYASAWERRARVARKDADAAESQEQWEDWDYYVDLADLCEGMAWKARCKMETQGIT